jgi:ABC-type antimicrobial peptide transport system permease subunit
LEDEVPEIARAIRYEGFSEILLQRGDLVFYEDNVRVTDNAFFEMFSFEFIEGGPTDALERPNSIVITEEIAGKYFPDGSALGKTLTMNRQRELVVTGVLANPPPNSTLGFDVLLPYDIRIESIREMGEEMDWGWFSPFTMVLLHESADPGAVNGKIERLMITHGEEADNTISLLPFHDLRYFFSNIKTYIYIFAVIALFVLAMACINYVNYSTARSADRSLEIGVRKVSGAGRRNLVIQLLSESVVLTIAALFLALALVELLLPTVNSITGLELSLDVVARRYAVPALLGLAVVVGIAAGAYPALYLSAFQPVGVLTGRLKSGAASSKLRKVLVVVQLSVAFFLICGTQVVHKQLGFAMGKDLGFDKEYVLNVELREGAHGYFETLKSELLRGDDIVAVTGVADDLPYFEWSTSTFEWEGKETEAEEMVYFNVVDYDFVATYGMNIVEGRGFSGEFPSDMTSGFVVNEKLARLMGPDSPLGKKVNVWDRTGTIVGVVRDFHHRPFTREIGPVFLLMSPDRKRIWNLAIRVKPGGVAGAIQHARETWERIVPAYPFEYTFLEDEVEGAYWGVSRMARLAAGFSLLAIVIAALGMFGLASFTAQRRTKEIAIRKVFGGSAADIAVLLSTEFVQCVVIAVVVAAPLAYIAMRKWLEGFVFRVGVGVDVFIVAAVLVLVTTALAVGWQTAGAMRRSPAISLGQNR